jgi:cytochrome c556
MMGDTAPMMGRGGSVDAAALAAMPADGVFNMVAQSCSACHTKFRLEKN